MTTLSTSRVSQLLGKSLALKRGSDTFCSSWEHLLLHFLVGSASQGTVSLFSSGLAHKMMIFPCSHPRGAVTTSALASESERGELPAPRLRPAALPAVIQEVGLLPT